MYRGKQWELWNHTAALRLSFHVAMNGPKGAPDFRQLHPMMQAELRRRRATGGIEMFAGLARVGHIDQDGNASEGE